MRIALLFCLLFGFVGVSAAQQQRVQKSVISGRAVKPDTLRQARYQVYNQNEYRSAEVFFEIEKQSFGWENPSKELTLLKDEQQSHSRHVSYQQSFKGLPVIDQQVHVNFDRFGRISMVISGYEEVDVALGSFNTNPSLSSDTARQIAFQKLASEKGKVSEPQLGVYNAKNPVLVWEMIVWPEAEPAQYRVFVDAQSGEVVSVQNQAVALRHNEVAHETEVSHGTVVARKNEVVQADGLGMVYDPSPLHVAGVSYGPPYIDADNADSPVLNAARKTVTLRGITQNNIGKYQLVGPYVAIVSSNQAGSDVYTPPTETSPDGFQYTRNQSGFEAVNAYYHIDKSQRYVQSLGISDLLTVPLRVNPQGLTSDDSYYFPQTPPILIFGTGGVDDAEDLSVIWHEYAHALLDAAAPGLLSTGEGQAFHEGWADYWASSYQRFLVENSVSARDDWRKLFAWDSGDGSIWSGRTVSSSGIYPRDVCTTGGGACNIYTDGLVWASTMMEVFDQLGREKTDRLSLLSHRYLAFPLKFSDAAQAVIQADIDYYNGANLSVLIDVFARRGLVDASKFAPIITHTQIPDTEDVGSSLQVEVKAIGVSGPLTSVKLFTESVSKGKESFTMTSAGNDQYHTSIVLPATLDSVFYYFKVEDAGGRFSYLPETAPTKRFRFTVGEDLHAPSIEHSPIVDAAFVLWPLAVSAKVTDNFSVGSVHVTYALYESDGQEVTSGVEALQLHGSLYSTTLAIPLATIKKGQILRYAIEARDGSIAENESRSPQTGFYEVAVSASGDLRKMDFETLDAITWSKNGQWEAGEPSYGIQFAQKGTAAFGTNLDGPYVSQGGQSVLELQAINLSNVDTAQLSIWHFYDTESENNVDPNSAGGIVYDGGVVQYRSNTSSEWRLLQPEGGYPGRVASDGSNPLSGLDAFGGYSYGWRQERFELPKEDGLLIRFVFGGNASNTHFSRTFAGWLIDDVIITTSTIQDQEAPLIIEHPEAETIYSVDDAVGLVEVVASDNVGIQEVMMHWTLQSGSNVESGVSRASQDEFESDRFGVFLEMTSSVKPGDVLAYHFEVQDPSGNVTRQPDSAGTNKIIFRLREIVPTTNEIWLTGDWRERSVGWIAVGDGKNQVSTLNLKSLQIPSNGELAELEMSHAFQFSTHMAGQVEISTDKGKAWTLLTPTAGYSGTVPVGSVPDMVGEKAFFGSSRGGIVSRFDLTEYVGKQVFIRIIVATSISSSGAQSWLIDEVSLKNESEADQFEIENTFELFPAYPNPFVARTNVSFSLKQAEDIDLRLYDMLGREVAWLFSGRQTEGSHSLVLERNDLVPGVYVLKLQAGSQLRTRNVVISR